MLFFGPLSSIFDYLTFSFLLLFFHAKGPLFQTGWFIESLATQVLIVFVIRTARSPFYKSRPSKWLIIASLGIVLTGIVIPFTPLAGQLGFIAPPPLYFVFLIIIVAFYLLLIEYMKNVFLKKYSL
jgi:Mg2+-importing ATPase